MIDNCRHLGTEEGSEEDCDLPLWTLVDVSAAGACESLINSVYFPYLLQRGTLWNFIVRVCFCKPQAGNGKSSNDWHVYVQD